MTTYDDVLAELMVSFKTIPLTVLGWIFFAGVWLYLQNLVVRDYKEQLETLRNKLEREVSKVKISEECPMFWSSLRAARQNELGTLRSMGIVSLARKNMGRISGGLRFLGNIQRLQDVEEVRCGRVRTGRKVKFVDEINLGPLEHTIFTNRLHWPSPNLHPNIFRLTTPLENLSFAAKAIAHTATKVVHVLKSSSVDDAAAESICGEFDDEHEKLLAALAVVETAIAC
jgi:hypothetical protein